ncbi:MAG: DUF2254 family protein [Bryobacterales bacterium]|nr:DUF2254 family protein [Bryobacterales bacterium]
MGEFAIEGVPLLSLQGINVADEAVRARLHTYYTIGRHRTIEQDAAFGIRQIVDVALKALSPGINDTTTAVMCLDYLSAILLKLSERGIDCSFAAEDGERRFFTNGPTFQSFVDDALTQIRQCAEGNPVILQRLIRVLSTVGERTALASRRLVLLAHAEAVVETAERSIASPIDRQRFLHLAETARQTLSEKPA